MAIDPKDIREAYDTDDNAWDPVRTEAKLDMRFVAGNPWTKADEEQRANRPTVANEEMGQYFNQVINGLMANPRGMKFSPVGNGANDEGAKFYQNKAREIEYRSNASVQYVTAATNAIQRGYGFVRVNTRYASPRSANQEIWIEGFPNPDMVIPPADSTAPDSSDAKRFFVFKWTPQAEFKRKYPDTKIKDFTDWNGAYPRWVRGSQILLAEYWHISTRKRKLLLVQPPGPTAPPRQIAPSPMAPQPVQQLFDDELKPGMQVLRELREVDYPVVKMYLTNGLEILHEQNWPGKYIPIVSCYGKVLYTEGDQGMEREILSMTRFGRQPWKSMCYADSQILEILSQVPKANVVAYPGQFAGFEKDWQEAPHVPKAYLYAHGKTAETGDNLLPLPKRLDYLQGENIQAALEAREVFRRAVQSAMGSNFLPTQAQRRNEKSGIALDKMDQSAAKGTYHFVDSYKGMIRQVAVNVEDVTDKIHDYTGDVGVIKADGTAESIRINDPDDPKSVSTKGDYLVTVSDGPSSDSEREAAATFTDTIVGNLQTVAAVSGQHSAAKVLGHSIRMRPELGAMGQQLADIIDPPQPGKDGKPVPPEIQAMMGQLQQKDQQLQQAAKAIESKQVEAEAQFKLETMKVEKQSALQVHLKQMELDDRAKDRAAKIEVARITAAKQSADLAAEAMEERLALGHEADQAAFDRQHDVQMAQFSQTAAADQSAQDHGEALEAGDQGVQGQLAVQAAAPQPEMSAGA